MAMMLELVKNGPMGVAFEVQLVLYVQYVLTLHLEYLLRQCDLEFM